jgi:hypothetical protein
VLGKLQDRWRRKVIFFPTHGRSKGQGERFDTSLFVP